MGDVSSAPNWTAALVLAELRRAMRRPVIRAPPRYSLLHEPEEALPPPDVVALAERFLGRQSPEYRALVVLAKPGISIREWCRELARSRATLYRQAPQISADAIWTAGR